MEDMEEKKGETVVDNTDSVPVNGQVQTPTKRDQLISLLTEEIPGYNADDDESSAEMLMGYINEGIYAQLPRYLKTLSREYKNDRAKMKQNEYSLQNKISELLSEYQTMNKEQRHDAQDISNPQIIISESFK